MQVGTAEIIDDILLHEVQSVDQLITGSKKTSLTHLKSFHSMQSLATASSQGDATGVLGAGLCECVCV